MTTSIPELVAHRGFTAQYPENTLLAIRAAVEAGARYVEFDIQLSADQVPVLFHDRDMQRMCGREGSVQDLTLVELQTLSVHEFSKFGYKYVGNRITTLKELVAYLATQPQVTAFVELKRNSLKKYGVATMLARIYEEIVHIQRQCVIISYDLEALQTVRTQTDYRIGAVFDDWREHHSRIIQQLHTEFVFTDIDLLPRWGKIHAGDSKVAVYECVDPEKALHVHHRGVALVETFAIEPMRTQLMLKSRNGE